MILAEEKTRQLSNGFWERAINTGIETLGPAYNLMQLAGHKVGVVPNPTFVGSTAAKANAGVPPDKILKDVTVQQGTNILGTAMPGVGAMIVGNQVVRTSIEVGKSGDVTPLVVQRGLPGSR